MPTYDHRQEIDIVNVRRKIDPPRSGPPGTAPQAADDPGHRRGEADAQSAQHEEPERLRRTKPHRLQNRDLLWLVVDHHYQRADDIEGRDDDDHREQDPD